MKVLNRLNVSNRSSSRRVPQRNEPRERHVDLPERRTHREVALGIAEVARRRLREGSAVEVVVDLLTGLQVGGVLARTIDVIADLVGPLNRGMEP